MIAKNFSYADINLFYKVNNSQILVYDTDVINQSLYTLFNTPQGSRIFNRKFGSSLESLVFENMTPAMQDIVAMLIYEEISEFEPRIRLDNPSDIQIVLDYDNNTLIVSIKYSLVEDTTQTDTFVGAIKL